MADHDKLTLDAEIECLVRSERQRRMGRSLAASELDDADRAWLDLSASTVRDDAGG